MDGPSPDGHQAGAGGGELIRQLTLVGAVQELKVGLLTYLDRAQFMGAVQQSGPSGV